MLCPAKKQLESNLRNHATSIKHLERVEAADSNKCGGTAVSSGRKERPSRSAGMTGSSNQKDLHWWLKAGPEDSEEGDLNPSDRGHVQSLMCWGFRSKTTAYAGKSYKVLGLLNDPHPGVNWYCEPPISCGFTVDGSLVSVNGCFRHQQCVCFSASGKSFLDFSCGACTHIPLETNFRLRVVREDRALEKRGTRGTEARRRLGYLSLLEVVCHNRSISGQFRHERMMHCHAKTKIAQLKMSRPTMKETTKAADGTKNLLKFVNNIIAAHRSGVLGGKPALWSYMKDVATNLNRKKSGYRFASNTKCFTQSMKMYGGKIMVNLFSLNYRGLENSTVIRENRVFSFFQVSMLRCSGQLQLFINKLRRCTKS